jgi:hypothetical protein
MRPSYVTWVGRAHLYPHHLFVRCGPCLLPLITLVLPNPPPSRPPCFLSQILVGNKSDCVTSRAVSTQEGQDFAAAHELTFFESSARTHSNVREVYVALAQRLSQ